MSLWEKAGWGLCVVLSVLIAIQVFSILLWWGDSGN